MENDDDLFLDWDDDTAFNDKYGTDLNDKVSFQESHSLRETDHDLDYALCAVLQMKVDSELKKKKDKNSVEGRSLSETDLDHAIAASFEMKGFKKLFKKKKKDKNSVKPGASEPLSIVDKQWELIDPVPDIHALFIEFDKKFFHGKLTCVEVRWSPRMTLCAGICSYQGRGGLCSIALSVPLLKLRPRSDLVETLLHEMIHAYLFVTHNNKDRDGHGPEFLSHMHRINKEAGTRISVYHSFHDEVNLYKQHWWKCDGPCNKRPPFWGFVKRAMNRAPGPNDNWWADHQSTCGGKFVKVKEPENYKEKKKEKKKRKLDSDSKTPQPLSDIRKFVKVGSSASSSEESKSKVTNITSPMLSPKQSVSSKQDNLGQNSIEASKKKSFVPFLGAGHKLGNSSETIKTYFNIPSTNAKKLHQEDNAWKLPATSPAMGGSAQSRLVKNFETQSAHKIVPKGHSINTAKPCLQNKKITDSFKTASEKTSILKNDTSESVVPNRNLSDSNRPLEKHIANPSDVPDNNVKHVYCPVCSNPVKEEINSHLDKCLKSKN